MKSLMALIIFMSATVSFGHSGLLPTDNDKIFFCTEVAKVINGNIGGEGDSTPPLAVDMKNCFANNTIKVLRSGPHLTVIKGEVKIETMTNEPYHLNSLLCSFSFIDATPFATIVDSVSCEE